MLPSSPQQAPTSYAIKPNFYIWFMVNAYGTGTRVKFTVAASANVDIMVMDQSQFSSFQTSGGTASIYRQLTGGITAEVPLPLGGEYYLVVYNDQSQASVTASVSYYTVPVDVYRLYSAAPAPTGMADYGVSNQSGAFVASRQSAVAVTGSATLNSVAAFNASVSRGASSYGAGLQMNAMLRVNTSSGQFVYWVQDVLSMLTNNKTAYFVDNIWNYSAHQALLNGARITGAGAVYSSGSTNYYAKASDFFRYVTPLNVNLPIAVSHSANAVTVSFGYQEASGGQPLPSRATYYDNATISEFRDVQDAALVVDGTQPDPGGNYFDSELVFGGGCCGASTTFTSMDSTLAISYRLANGGGASPKSVFEFGSDTAETAYNLQTTYSQGAFHVGLGRLDFARNYLLAPSVSVPLTFSYTVADGSTLPASPTLSYNGNGTLLTTPIGTVPKTVKVDQGSSWTISVQVTGSQNERWVATQGTTGTVAASQTLVVTYYHQYLVAASFSSSGGNPPPIPSLSSTAAGASFNAALSQINTSYWLDSGAAWSVGNPLSGPANSQRWAAPSGTSGKVTLGLAIRPTFVSQYLVTISFDIADGAAAGGVMVNETILAAGTSAQLDTSGTTAWLDSGSTLVIGALTSGSSSHERWISNSTLEWGVSGSFVATSTFRHEYFLGVRSSAPTDTNVSPSSGWFSPGTSVTLGATAGAQWKFEGWAGDGSGSYTGQSDNAAFTLGGPVNETATFYPGLEVVSGSGGAVSYISGSSAGVVGSGSSKVVYAQPGSPIVLAAQPGFLQSLSGWSGSANGSSDTVVVKIDSPSQATASFALNFSEVGAMAGVVVVAAGVLLAFRRRGGRRPT